MIDNTLVSIAMTTYNGEKYLEEQLDSIYAQTYKNIEVIVCDDCSSDGTVEVLNIYKEKFGLQYYVNKSNLGYVKNFEQVISLCSGKYIALSDQDDIWFPEKIEVLISEIGDNLLIHSDYNTIDMYSNLISPNKKGMITSHTNLISFAFSNVVTGCTVLMDKKILRYALPFSKGLAYHDWWLAIIAAKFGKIKYINKALIQYRRHDLQCTKSNKNGMLCSFIQENIPALLSFCKLKKNIIINSIYTFILRIYTKLTKKEFPGFKTYQLHLNNLNSVKSHKIFTVSEKSILNDAIKYYTDYINNIIHLKYYFIKLKYYFIKLKYFKKNST